MTVTLRPHQLKALDELGDGHILCGGVGSGKSITAAAYYVLRESPKDVYVFTTAKKRDHMDWDKEFLKFDVSTDAELSVHGKLTVDSWNNIGKYTEVTDAFFIFDEQRIVGSGSWVKSFLKIARANRWILLSATPGDNWMDYVPVFLANGFYKNRTDFIRQHVIYTRFSKFPKVERYVGISKLVRLRKQLLVDMPYERHTTRHHYDIDCDYDRERFERVWKDRWHVYEDRPLRDVAELCLVARKVVNSSESRLQAVREALGRHKSLIVFYNFNFELEQLRTLAKNFSEAKSVSPSIGDDLESDQLVVAEWNGHRHQPIPETDRWLYLVQYQAGAEGWDCITTDAMIFYSATYSFKLYEQAQGRIDRLITPFNDLHYYNLWSDSPIDKMIKKNRMVKKGFNEQELKVVW